MGQRLPLFADAVRFADIGPKDLERIAWSHSRRQLLEQCARRYFYEHFGASSRLSDSPTQELLRFLKSLENRYERAGAIVHQVIATWFRKAQQGDRWTPDRLERWGQGLYRRDLAFSAANPGGNSVDPEDNWPPKLLREYHYRDPNAVALCSEVEERLVLALRSFARSAVFARIRERGSAADALVETRMRVQGLPCRVEGQVDLAFADDGEITIVDWKLGASDGAGDDSLQLAVYGLWADQRWTDGRPVTVYKAYLGDETLVRWELTDQRRSAARARIVQDAERMAVLQGYGEDGVVEAFSPCLQPAVCGQCCFLRACTEGRACLGDRN
jgi:hypothetical protein